MAWFDQQETHLDPLYEANDLERRALAQQKWGSLDVAEDLFKKALQIRQEHVKSTEYDLLNELGYLYLLMRRYNDAVPLFQQAIEMIEKEFYANHPLITRPLDNWALACIAGNDWEQAEQLLKRSLQVKESSLLHQDVLTLETERTLAEVQRHLGKFADAEATIKKAMKFVEVGTISPVEEFLYEQALCYQDQGKFAEAEEIYERALPIFYHRAGKNRRFAMCLESFAELLRNLDKNERADKLQAEAQRIIEDSLPHEPVQNTPGPLFMQPALFACTIVH